MKLWKIFNICFFIVWLIAFIALFPDVATVFNEEKVENIRMEALKSAEIPDWIDVQLLGEGTARKEIELSAINSIVVHYVGNPDTTAQQNRDYFNTAGVEVASHFVVGLDGEIIQCLPLWEKSAASNWRNKDTISIEVCHPDITGKFNEKTYDSLIKLVGWLCSVCDFNKENIIRHYDITGKECPRYYVKNEDEWEKFKDDVEFSLKIGEAQV